VAVVSAAVLGSWLLPGGAGAAIKIYENSEAATYLGEVRKANCRVKQGATRKRFHAGARTTNGAYALDLTILDFKGFKP
jgi:hypothetical protein